MTYLPYIILQSTIGQDIYNKQYNYAPAYVLNKVIITKVVGLVKGQTQYIKD